MASTNQHSLVEVSCTSLGKYSAKTSDNEYLGAGWRGGGWSPPTNVARVRFPDLASYVG